MRRVRKSQLGPLSFIAEGGAGRVYRCGAPISGLPSPLAYKEILANADPLVQQATLAGMTAAVSMRDAMSAADIAELDALAAWPLALVEDGGAVVGCLLPLLGKDFFLTARPPGQPPTDEVFELQKLCASDKWLQRMGIDRSAADDGLVRLALMARLAYAFELIHRNGLVYGDVSLKNAAIATEPPRLMLMDCDGIARLSDQSRVQLQSPFFSPPEMISKQVKLQDQQTDVYKLGLCVIRCLARGAGVTQLMSPLNPTMIAGLLDQPGVDLLTRATGADRAQRPTAEELKEYLVERVLTLLQPAELLSATLSCRLLLRGSEAVVTWTHRHATKLRIFGLNGFEVADLDPDGHPYGYAIRPPTSGPIFVEVANTHGSEQLEAGFIDYYELPTFDIAQQLQGLLPRLSVPDLAPVQIPDVLAALPPRPMVSTDAHPVPRIDLPPFGRDLAPLLSQAGPGRIDPSAVRSTVDRAVENAAGRIGEAMTDGVRALRNGIEASIRARVASLADDGSPD